MAETKLFENKADLFVAAGAIVIVMMLIIPLPTILLDMLMAINLVINLLILLIVLYTKKATDFSVFPTLLLVSTVFGLGLNVSSTRLILSQGMKFDGKMIKAFSTFVIGNKGGAEGLVIGFVIFIILIAVQAFVITKGSTRVAEVAARFTLDAMPTKNMAIEAEYNAGAITEEEARARKREVQKEADFYGAMDGASKFVSGNVKIGIFITVVNIVAGLAFGMIFRGEPFAQAIGTYAALTIGDGLLSQLPALFVSVATGLIVTRSVSDGTFGSDITDQFSRNARVYYVGAATLLVIAVLPGFPWYVLIPLAAALGWVGQRLRKAEASSFKKSIEKAEQKEKEKTGENPADISPVVPLDPLSLELGYGLIPLVDKDKGAELLERVTRIRRESALDLGLVVPRIRIIDNMRLEPSEYCFKIKGVEVARGRIRMGWYLGINPGGVTEDLPGEKTTDPTFGLPAIWIAEENRERAERAGYTVVDPPSIIATHLTEIIKRNASGILGRQEVQSIVDTIRKDYPAVVDEVNKCCTLGEIQKVLQGLLREQVSIRNMVVILETLADYRPITKDTTILIEKVRQALARQICLQYVDDARTLHALTIEPTLVQKIVDSRVDTVNGPIAALEPADQRAWIRALTRSVSSVQQAGYIPIILCPEEARILVKSSTEREIPELVVLSVPEISNDIKVEAIGEIKKE
ncbi:MAG TPA: flagellar biosynthesis protein FlhA [Treponemataceae bacterium]|nr:flagellar biosynthesis protein FlhA [Treponemataceae bacterium]HPS44406.1 flagellar biosynthesis protein FlhA [Treponemataceae bacterium]